MLYRIVSHSVDRLWGILHDEGVISRSATLVAGENVLTKCPAIIDSMGRLSKIKQLITASLKHSDNIPENFVDVYHELHVDEH